MKTAMLIVLLLVLSAGLIAQTGFGNHPEFEIRQVTNLGVQSGVVSTRTLDLQIELTGTGQVRLFWNTDPEAVSYKIYHAESPLPPGETGWSVLAETAGTFYVVDPTAARGFFYVTSVSEDLGTFVLVDGGTFNNGTSDVTVSSFYMDKFELTQAGYQAVMGSNPASGYGVGANYAVYSVSWFNAIEYCNRRSLQTGLTPCYSYSTYGTNPDNWPAGWISNPNHIIISCSWTANGYRLPTEMEWQFAARGGNSTHNYTYSGNNDINPVAWYTVNSGFTAHTVGTKAANELGLFDMSGNVWEWNWDIYGSYPDDAQNNPHGAVSGENRVYRGGSWVDPAVHCPVSFRYSYVPAYNNVNLGFRVCRSLDNFVLVGGGTFNNGTSDVTVSSFYMDKFELTQAGYLAEMGVNPASGYGVGSNYPVYYVSWYKAIEYCNRRSMQEGLSPCYSYSTYGTNPSNWPAGWYFLSTNHINVNCNWTANGYRLPTEAEWQFAARGGNQTHNYTYSGSADINAVAWYYGNSGNTTHTVGTKTANELGLFDMSGNVWEWNWDIYGSYPGGSQTNPHGAVDGLGRVRRGGGWNDGSDYCTVSSRGSGYATGSDSNLGFRCVRVSP